MTSAGPAPRRRSLWGWGFAERFPDEAARQGLCALARVLVPHGQPQLLPLPAERPALPPPRLAPPRTLAPLSSQEPWDRAAHRRGRAYPDLVAGFLPDRLMNPGVLGL